MICLLLLDIKSSVSSHNIPMERFYEYFEITRQGFAQKLLIFRAKEKLVNALKEEIYSYRLKCDRRAGSRSMFYNLEIKKKYGIGITKFEQLISEVGLSLVPLRIKVVTTESCHQSWNYQNLINGLVLRGINQVIVGDITYLYIFRSRYYLFCLTDIFSNRIVGYCLSKRMRSLEALETLIQCVDLRGEEYLKNCIHHTDGGRQYFSKIYLELTIKVAIKISVANNCLENGYAEQRNGFFKYHLLPTMDLSDESKLQKEVDAVIYRYNHERKQKSLGWQTPVGFEKRLENPLYNPSLRLHDHMRNMESERNGF